MNTLEVHNSAQITVATYSKVYYFLKSEVINLELRIQVKCSMINISIKEKANGKAVVPLKRPVFTYSLCCKLSTTVPSLLN